MEIKKETFLVLYFHLDLCFSFTETDWLIVSKTLLAGKQVKP